MPCPYVVGKGFGLGAGFFFEGGSGMNEGCPPGDDDLDRGCNEEGWAGGGFRVLVF